IFDVEVAFFFPWAVVFGKANTLARTETPETKEEAKNYNQQIAELVPAYPENAASRREYSQADPARAVADTQRAAGQIAWFAFWDILVFFGVLLVGFAYLWKRGDLDWVRSTAAEKAAAGGAIPGPDVGGLVTSGQGS